MQTADALTLVIDCASIHNGVTKTTVCTQIPPFFRGSFKETETASDLVIVVEPIIQHLSPKKVT